MLNYSARCADLCNSGIIPTVVRDHSLVGMSPAQQREFGSSTVYLGQKDMTERVESPMGEDHLLCLTTVF